MPLPNAENAVVDIRKLRDYCLNLNHEVGGHKARVFAAALNLTYQDAEILRAALLEAVRTHEADIGNFDEYGQRYTVDFEFERQGKSAVVRSGWIVDANSNAPRLVTCLIL